MKRFINWFGAATLALAAALTGCGGGGSGGSDVAEAPVQGGGGGGSQTQTGQVTCPDGTTAASNDKCSIVMANVSAIASTTLDPKSFNSSGAGIPIPYSGAMKNDGIVVTLTQGTLTVPATGSIGAGGRSIVVKTAGTAVFGRGTHLKVVANDSIGRSVTTEFDFTTGPKSCSDNAKWSNPATFVPPIADCVAPEGVQALRVSAPAKSDACLMGIGDTYGGACLLDAAADVFTFVNTGSLVGTDVALWVGFDSGGLSYVDLVDYTTLKVAAQVKLPKPLKAITGNPTGAAIIQGVEVQLANDEVGLISYDGAAVKYACKKNCP